MKMSHGRLLILAAAVAAAGCASASGGVQSTPVKPAATGAAAITPTALLARKRFTRILVNADCTAYIDDASIVGKRAKKVGWVVEDAGCSPNGNDWHIELVFDDADWNKGSNRTVKITPDDLKAFKIHPQAEYRKRTYKVWLVQTGFWGEITRNMVIDPEVDIQM